MHGYTHVYDNETKKKDYFNYGGKSEFYGHSIDEQILRIDFESDTDLPLDDVSEIDNLISLADKNFTYGSKEISNFILGGNVL